MRYLKNLDFNDSLDDSMILYMHIPKTAGTSFIDLLKSQYKGNELLRVSNNAEADKKIQYLDPKTKVICGHFDLFAGFLHSSLLTPYSLVTILRDPIERTISQIYYLKNTPSHEYYNEIQGLSISDIFVKRPELAIKFGLVDSQMHRLSPSMRGVSREGVKLKGAADNLNQNFTFFGFTEDLDSFMSLCVTKFGWPKEIVFPYLNYAPPTRNDSIIKSDMDLELIKNNNRYDTELYKAAKLIFNQKFGKFIIDLHFEEEQSKSKAKDALTKWQRVKRFFSNLFGYDGGRTAWIKK